MWSCWVAGRYVGSWRASTPFLAPWFTPLCPNINVLQQNCGFIEPWGWFTYSLVRELCNFHFQLTLSSTFSFSTKVSPYPDFNCCFNCHCLPLTLKNLFVFLCDKSKWLKYNTWKRKLVTDIILLSSFMNKNYAKANQRAFLFNTFQKQIEDF